MFVSLSLNPVTTVLESPIYNVVKTTCLTVGYRLSGDQIQFYVNVTQTDGNTATVISKGFGDQTNYPSWSMLNVTIAGGFSKFDIIAEKMSYTNVVRYAYVNNITVSEGPCASTGRLTTTTSWSTIVNTVMA